MLMTLRGRVIATLVAALVTIALLGWQMSLRHSEARASLDLVVDTLAPAATAVADLDSDVHNMDRRLRIYVSSGDDSYRLLYEAAVVSARANIDRLTELVAGGPSYDILLDDVSTALDDWLASVGTPAIDAMPEDEPAARRTIDSPGAQESYARLSDDVYRLRTLIARDQQVALADSAEAARRLAWSLGLALAILLLLPVGVYLSLRSSVLRPVEALRAQLRAATAAGQHDTVIVPTGPSELRDLGKDAEALRRALVHEIDQATAARTALEQEGPVVDAIRRELAARTDAHPVGVSVAGLLRPAEGVLAGDFWDRTPLTDGRTAAIICDVSGHGARAGVVAMRLKTSLMLGLLAGQDTPQILHRACDAFADEPGRFATMAILVVDPPTGDLSWVNAGHPAPRVIRAGGAIERLSPTGPMLSWLGGAWTVGTTRLGPADVCLAFTDGILESRDVDGEELGDDELDQLLLTATRGSTEPGEVVAHALARVRERADDLGRDDITLLALRLDPLNDGTIPIPRS